MPAVNLDFNNFRLFYQHFHILVINLLQWHHSTFTQIMLAHFCVKNTLLVSNDLVEISVVCHSSTGFNILLTKSIKPV